MPPASHPLPPNISVSPGGICTPFTYHHNKNLRDHDNESYSTYYCVFRGHIPGIYLTHTEGEQQVLRFSNFKWKVFAKHADALAYWQECCREDHDHRAKHYKVKGYSATYLTFDEAAKRAAQAYVYEA
ncbi:hypothetical protein C8R43DRAFT_1120975 [Mycena crocata]|nr:hypothetical protein C8R43DRAFT_1120975 [Mycena crocata]